MADDQPLKPSSSKHRFTERNHALPRPPSLCSEPPIPCTRSFHDILAELAAEYARVELLCRNLQLAEAEQGHGNSRALSTSGNSLSAAKSSILFSTDAENHDSKLNIMDAPHRNGLSDSCLTTTSNAVNRGSGSRSKCSTARSSTLFSFASSRMAHHDMQVARVSSREPVSQAQLKQFARRPSYSIKKGAMCSDKFTTLCAALIIANSIFTGLQVSYWVDDEFDRLSGRGNVKSGSHRMWLLGDAIFCTLFTLELTYRFCRDGWLFSLGHERYWNLFDSVVVASAVVDLWFQLLGWSLKLGFGVLRVLRIVRIVRVLRVGNGCKVLFTLKTMLYGLTASANSFTAAILLLVGFMYIIGLMFMAGVQRFISDISAEDMGRAHADVASLRKRFGSFGTTLWTLLVGIAGGEDWNAIAVDLNPLGPIYKGLFVCYVSVVILALLNILSGTFLSAAMQTSAMDRQLMVQKAITESDAVVRHMVQLFTEADADHNGRLTWEEFIEYMHDERVIAYLMSLELDMSSAKKVFSLLDPDDDGELSLDHFVHGCLRLRGAAKVVDIAILEASIDSMFADMCEMCSSGVQMSKPSATASIQTWNDSKRG